ncbi:hypothetical protein BASA81_010417, partial [Batrachochytrium salamandrivorans]
MEESSEFIARNLEKLDKQDPLPTFEPKHRPKQCESVVASTKHSRLFFKVGDMVKMKHHDRLKLEFKWK